MINQNPDNYDADPNVYTLHIRPGKVNQNEIQSPSGDRNYQDDHLNKTDK
jgi:hypothetical protein